MFGTLRIKIALTALILIFADTCLAGLLAVGGGKPVFSLLLLAYAAFHWDSKRILPLAAVLGLTRDFLGGGVWGVEMFAFVCGGFILDAAAHKIEREFPGIYFLLTVIFCVFVLGLELAIDSLLGNPVLNPDNWRMIFMSALLTGLFLPLFYQIADFFFKPHAELRQYELFR